jgi:catechol 2,3-dioxygenase
LSLPELGHVALFVRDLERAKDFYIQAVGLRPVGNLMQGGVMALTGGRTHHELLLIEVGERVPTPSDRQPGLYHLAWKVGENLEELRACRDHLRKLAIPIEAAVDHLISQSLYLKDPDGNRVELYVDDPNYDWRADSAWLNAAPAPLQL